MKKRLILLSILAGSLQFSCTKHFDELNVDPNQASEAIFNANLLLPSAQWKYVESISGYNSVLFQSMWIQAYASTSTGGANYYSNGDKYVLSNNTLSYLDRVWNNAYNAASFAYEMEQLAKKKGGMSNLENIGTIMQIQSLATASDVFGDIPYSQALQAKTGNITQPTYDTQESIYKSLLTRLETAVTALNANQAAPTNDAFAYKGNIGQWKRYGYSLMLKLAMRLTKADPTTAKTYAEKAAAGGVFTSVADDAYVMADLTNSYTNANASALATAADLYQLRWSKTMIDYLKSNEDPRLGKIAEVPAAGLAANQTATGGDNTPANQLGLPNGYDLSGGATDITKAPNYPGATGTGNDVTPLGKYSRPTNVFRNQSGPLFVLTYAETELLLAEAATRGYTVTGSAATHYKNAVSAGLQSLAKFGTTVAIDAATADAYATAHPLVAANALKQINEQYWATTSILQNFIEAWSNWRRSGYPQLTPVNYTGNFSSGSIPRRELYPTGEGSLNPTNYKEAASRLPNGDVWTSRIWWDKQ
ncbi:SusD/RagB family nutrient-binding outer membrane lipoprotein [Siphonobacter curvatus]|nr:SusD/RagB family nutrient-binding outer membrane lipoprotein [Siphonobacter curvatus]